MFKYMAVQLIGLTGLTGRLAEALEFWIFDTLKITVILLGVVFAVSYLGTYLPPEKIRDFLKGKKAIVGYFLAGVLGIISPFCSCSTVPLFLGFVGVGVPFGMTITFLTVSPMVNTAALSVPQFVLLKQVMKRNLIIAYGGIIGFGIMVLGFLFNLIF